MAQFVIGGIEVRDRVGMRPVLEAVLTRFLAVPGCDPALVARVTLSPKRVGVIHGRCRYPKPVKGHQPGAELARQGYLITGAVRTDRGAYPLGFGHWGALRAPRAKQGWRSGPVLYGFETATAAAGFVIAHELAHVALRQKWVRAKNTEAVTNALALEWCSAAKLTVAVLPADGRARLMPPAAVLAGANERQLRLW